MTAEGINPILTELYTHMEWADALIWKTVYANEQAMADDDLRERLFHVHFTQRAFLQVWTGDPFERLKPDAFPTMPALLEWCKPYYGEVRSFMKSLDTDQLNGPMVMPWAKFFVRQAGVEARETTLGETMLQVASHSTHHRAQNNMLLRQFGTEPPMVDYIGWLWLDRPAPEWP